MEPLSRQLLARYSNYFYLIGIFVSVFLLFSVAYFFSFVNWDDGTNIYNNAFYNPVTQKSLAQFWVKPFNDLYTPVTNTLWGLCAVVSRLPKPTEVLGGGVSPFDPHTFHLMGILFHAATAVIAFLLLRRLTQNDTGSLLGAIFWAVHPVQVEPVAWVTGHNNVFSGFFGMLALLVYVRAAQKNKTSDLVSATLLYLLALLAKPTAVAVPLLAAAIELFILRRPLRQWLPLIGGWAVLAVGLAIFTHASSPSSAGIIVALWKRPIIALDAITFYLGKIAFPLVQGVDYGRLPDRVVGNAWGYICAAITLVVTAICFLLDRKKIHWPLAAFALLVAGTFPMLGLVPYYFMRASTVADRYLYLALLGPAFAIATVISMVPAHRQRLASAIAVALLCLYAVRSTIQLRVWHDSITLFKHAVDVNPNSWLARNNLGIALADSAQLDAALSQAQQAQRLDPNSAALNNSLGVAYGEQGKNKEAIAAFKDAIRLNPDFPEAHYHLGVVLADSGDLEGAIQPLRDAVRLKPDFTEAWFRLGVSLGKTGKQAEAIDALAQTEKLRPSDSEARYIRAVLLGNAKRNPEAESEFLEVTRQQPKYANAWYGLATIRERLGKHEEARQAFTETLRLDPTNAKAKAALDRLTKTHP